MNKAVLVIVHKLLGCLFCLSHCSFIIVWSSDRCFSWTYFKKSVRFQNRIQAMHTECKQFSIVQMHIKLYQLKWCLKHFIWLDLNIRFIQWPSFDFLFIFNNDSCSYLHRLILNVALHFFLFQNNCHFRIPIKQIQMRRLKWDGGSNW